MRRRNAPSWDANSRGGISRSASRTRRVRGLQGAQARRQGVPTTESVGEEWSQRPLFQEAVQRGRAQRDAFAYLAGGRIERDAMLAKMRSAADEGAWSRFAEGLESLPGG